LIFVSFQLNKDFQPLGLISHSAHALYSAFKCKRRKLMDQTKVEIC